MPILVREDAGAVARLTMNAPEKLNALSDAMLAALQAEFDRLRDETHIRASPLAVRARRSAPATTSRK